MADTVRCFFGLPVDSAVQNALTDIRKHWAPRLGPAVRWVPEGTHHITLRFLGHLNKKKLSLIEKTWPESLKPSQAVVMDLDRWGCFPDRRHPRVIWLGGGVPPALADLKDRLDSCLNQCGLPRDAERFHPHITIARVKNAGSAPSIQTFLDHISDRMFPRTLFNRVCFWESRLTPQGPVYRCINELILTGGPSTQTA